MKKEFKDNIKTIVKFEEYCGKKKYYEALFRNEYLTEFKRLINLCMSDIDILKSISCHTESYSDVKGHFAEVSIDMTLKNDGDKLIINDRYEFKTTLDIDKLYDKYYEYLTVCDYVDRYWKSDSIFIEAISTALDLNKHESVRSFYLTGRDKGIRNLSFTITTQLINKVPDLDTPQDLIIDRRKFIEINK